MTIVNATYQTEGLPQLHRGNPLIQALPPILDGKAQFKQLSLLPGIDMRASKAAPEYIRQYDVEALSQIYFPPPESMSYASTIDRLLRRSYLNRNPTNPAHVRELYVADELIQTQGAGGQTLAGIATLKGSSGMGKSRLTKALLSAYPQVIQHSDYPGLPSPFRQVVWLSVEAPIGGAMRSFMISLFEALDEALQYTGTEKSYTDKVRRTDSYSDLIMQFNRVARSRWLGLLHIDDIQRIAETSTDKEHVMQIMIRLANVARFGLVFSGTEDIAEIIAPALQLSARKKAEGGHLHETLQREMEITRRMVSEGYVELKRPQSPQDPFFQALVNRLLEYQWLDEPRLASEGLYDLIYKLSCGIPSVVVRLFKVAQVRALTAAAKTLENKHFVMACRHELRPLWPLINRLRKGLISEVEFSRGFDEVFEAVKNP